MTTICLKCAQAALERDQNATALETAQRAAHEFEGKWGDAHIDLLTMTTNRDFWRERCKFLEARLQELKSQLPAKEPEMRLADILPFERKER